MNNNEINSPDKMNHSEDQASFGKKSQQENQKKQKSMLMAHDYSSYFYAD